MEGGSQWRIQDFPQGGAPTAKSAIIFQFFCRKLHENERIWNPGGEMKMIVSRLLAVADLHNKILDMHPFGPIFLLFMQFSANFGQIIRWLPRFRLAPREILDPPLAWPKGVSHVPSGGYLSRAVSVWGSLSREVSIEGGLSLGGGVSVQGSLCQGEDRVVCILLITARKRSLGQGNISSSVCQGFCLRGGVPGLSGCLVPGGGAWSRGGLVQGVVWSRRLSGPGGV